MACTSLPPNKGPGSPSFPRTSGTKPRPVNRLFLYEDYCAGRHAPPSICSAETLRGNKLLGIRGILNGTTNFVLDELEKGVSYDDAIHEAQRIQLAEADPSMDVDGWVTALPRSAP